MIGIVIMQLYFMAIPFIWRKFFAFIIIALCNCYPLPVVSPRDMRV